MYLHIQKKKRKEKGKIQQVSNERLRTSNPNQLPSVSLRYIYSLSKSTRLRIELSQRVLSDCAMCIYIPSLMFGYS